MHRDQIDSERLVRASLGLGDFGVEQLGRHGAAGDDSEAAGVGDGGGEVAFADPAHGPAHDGDVAAEELGAAMHQLLELDMPLAAVDGARLGNQSFAAHAAAPALSASASSPKAL